MKLWMRLACLLTALLMLSGCGLFAAQPADVETTQSTNATTPSTEPESTGGIFIYDENILFAGGKLDELMDLAE